MNATSLPETPPAPTNAARIPWLPLFLLAFVALWAPLVIKMHADWATNPQYGFGDFVPFFIGFLLWLRWRDRPQSAPPEHAGPLLAAIAALMAVLLPVRIIEESNP